MTISLTDDVKIIMTQLNINGYESFVVGGCVRDSLMNIKPNDWDICTNAKPEEIKNCFKSFKVFEAGIEHGTISVFYNNQVYEITTYRIDGKYCDNRHPKSVIFTDNITKDLSRRDFTVNAIAYSEITGIIDPFNGIEDIKNKIIRCVGDPDKKFNEDALRIIRALRFSATLGFTIDNTTSLSILNNYPLLSNISIERINTEFSKLLCGNYVMKALDKYRDVFALFIPELKAMFDFNQCTIHHDKDVWQHTIFALNEIDNRLILRLTMLFHDLGKPLVCKTDTDGTCHFKGHQNVSAQLAHNILCRLKYPTKTIKTCLTLIEYHDVRFNENKIILKKVMNSIGKDNTQLLFNVQLADTLAQSKYLREQKLKYINTAKKQFNQIIANNECYSLNQLTINGNDLKNLGITNGKTIGFILNQLINMVIEERIENDKDVLIKTALNIYNK